MTLTYPSVLSRVRIFCFSFEHDRVSFLVLRDFDRVQILDIEAELWSVIVYIEYSNVETRHSELT